MRLRYSGHQNPCVTPPNFSSAVGARQIKNSAQTSGLLDRGQAPIRITGVMRNFLFALSSVKTPTFRMKFFLSHTKLKKISSEKLRATLKILTLLSSFIEDKRTKTISTRLYITNDKRLHFVSTQIFCYNSFFSGATK